MKMRTVKYGGFGLRVIDGEKVAMRDALIAAGHGGAGCRYLAETCESLGVTSIKRVTLRGQVKPTYIIGISDLPSITVRKTDVRNALVEISNYLEETLTTPHGEPAPAAPVQKTIDEVRDAAIADQKRALASLNRKVDLGMKLFADIKNDLERLNGVNNTQATISLNTLFEQAGLSNARVAVEA